MQKEGEYIEAIRPLSGPNISIRPPIFATV
jgi:hypothetical protein